MATRGVALRVLFRVAFHLMGVWMEGIVGSLHLPDQIFMSSYLMPLIL
ncbi:hypothetical protein X975_05492, partial [Stegodyphus mimosarum]